MANDTLTFNSHGKFLITAEYLILKGAMGLALPLKQGQVLTVTNNNTGFINWESLVFGEVWFRCKINIHDFTVDSTTNEEISTTLANIFKVAKNAHVGFITMGANVTINADFNLAWGLGSSSTLINNIATWAGIDPYILLGKTFGGSGYDIACAGAKGPITYQLNPSGRTVNEVNFQPGFCDHIFFVYLGKKMNSRTGMSYFREKATYSNKEITRINEITQGIIAAQSRTEFENLLNEHEHIMSAILQMPTIKESNFTDYSHTIKSMGAWGGDFVLVTGNNFEEVKKYFNTKGLETVISYNEMVL